MSNNLCVFLIYDTRIYHKIEGYRIRLHFLHVIEGHENIIKGKASHSFFTKKLPSTYLDT